MKSNTDSFFDSDVCDIAEKSPDGRYIRYSETLSNGASKVAYKGFDLVDGTEVSWNKSDVHDWVQAEEYVERLKKQSKHKNIIRTYSSWVDEKSKIVNTISESFTSGTLRQFRKKHRGVDMAAIKNWARQILRGLCYLHSHDPPVVHGDLNPENIFVNGNTGEVKIGNLGFKEKPEEEEHNTLVDVYAFGLCMLELVTCEYLPNVKPIVKGMEAKQFIEKCLLPASIRFSAFELLKDSFLEANTRELVPPVMELGTTNQKSGFRLKGIKKDENSILLMLKIADLCGRGSLTKIEFVFNLDTDTTHEIAGEMVQELSLMKEDVASIVELMDKSIARLVPCEMPSFVHFSGLKGSCVDPIPVSDLIPPSSIKVSG